MKKISFFIILVFILSSCQSAKDAFTLKKKPSADEFLVEKKSPLVMPPDFGKLPKPNDGQKIQEIGQQPKTNNIKNLLTNNENLSTQKKPANPSSLEKKILKKMK